MIAMFKRVYQLKNLVPLFIVSVFTAFTVFTVSFTAAT